MLRRLFIKTGEFIRGDFFTRALLTVYGASGGVTIIINVFTKTVAKPTSPFEVARDAFLTFMWLFLFLLLTYLASQALALLLIATGNYYPNRYYFPKIDVAAEFTPENQIKVTFTNPKRNQRLTLRAIYGRIDSKVRHPDVVVSGVAPDSVKELLPLSNFEGRASQSVIIGRRESGTLFLSGGNKETREIKIETPGTYEYLIGIYGIFRGRNYSGTGTIPITITEDRKIDVEARVKPESKVVRGKKVPFLTREDLAVAFRTMCSRFHKKGK